jgi:hypothetical protein
MLQERMSGTLRAAADPSSLQARPPVGYGMAFGVAAVAQARIAAPSLTAPLNLDTAVSPRLVVLIAGTHDEVELIDMALARSLRATGLIPSTSGRSNSTKSWGRLSGPTAPTSPRSSPQLGHRPPEHGSGVAGDAQIVRCGVRSVRNRSIRGPNPAQQSPFFSGQNRDSRKTASSRRLFANFLQFGLAWEATLARQCHEMQAPSRRVSLHASLLCCGKIRTDSAPTPMPQRPACSTVAS